MAGFVVRSLICALGLALAAWIVPSLEFRSNGVLLLAAVLLGVVNAIVRPVAVILTLPITILTLGVFLLVVNAAMLGLVAALLDGFELGGFWAALFGSLIVSFTSWMASWYVGPRGNFEVLIVEQRFGAGKVLFQATDELWRLRYLTQDKFYGRYWLQTLRYLTRSVGEDDLGELITNRRVYERGEPVQVRLKTALASPEMSPRVSITGPAAFTRELIASKLHPELFTAELTGLPTGNYQVVWQVPDSTVSLSADFRVQLARQELKDRNMNRSELSRVAEQTGGRFAEISSARRLAEQIPPGQKILLEALAPQPLWNRWELLVLIFGLLTGEWILRKRYQLV